MIANELSDCGIEEMWQLCRVKDKEPDIFKGEVSSSLYSIVAVAFAYELLPLELNRHGSSAEQMVKNLTFKAKVKH